MRQPRRSRFKQVVINHLLQVKASLLLAALCMLGFTLTGLLAPWPLKIIFDYVLLDHRLGGLEGQLGQAPDRLIEVGHVGDKDQDVAWRHPTIEHLQGAQKDHSPGADGCDHLHNPSGGSLHAGSPDTLFQGLIALGFKPFLLISLPAKGLHYGDRHEDLTNSRGDPPLASPLALGRGLDFSVEIRKRVDQDRKRRQDDQAQAPVQGEHDRKHPEES